MSIEQIRLNGMQDRRLELGAKKPWREKVTPTKESDIEDRAKAYKRLVSTAIVHTMALEGSSDSPEQQEIHSAALMTVKDEVRHFGFAPELFGEVVSTKVRDLKKRAKQEAEDARLADELEQVIRDRKGAISGDWKIIDQEMPGDFQARQGDVPASFSEKDAFGFPSKPVVRGW